MHARVQQLVYKQWNNQASNAVRVIFPICTFSSTRLLRSGVVSEGLCHHKKARHIGTQVTFTSSHAKQDHMILALP